MTPRTAAGQRFHEAIWLDGGAEPMRSHLDYDESAQAIHAIEDEAARDALVALREKVEALSRFAPDFDGRMLEAQDAWWINRSKVLALIDAALS